MSGGLLQLVAYGAQDIYLTGSPQITFFKVVYRRHTNFAMESIEQTFNGAADWGRKVTCTISRNGDLIHRMYFVVTLPKIDVQNGQAFRWLDWLGHIIVDTVEIEIGGQRIDKHYGNWLHIWNELTQTAGHQTGYANMVGQTPKLTNIAFLPPDASATANVDITGGRQSLTVPSTTLYIPLQFWFNRNPGLALPLIALQYHEVKVNIEIAKVSNTYWAADVEITSGTPNQLQVSTNLSSVKVPSLSYASLYVDYIYLDTDERRRFAQVSHEYLIEQLQFTGDESVSAVNNKIKLNFNHPTKELIWVVQRDDFVRDSIPGGKQFFNFSDEVDSCSIAPLFGVCQVEDTDEMFSLDNQIKNNYSLYNAGPRVGMSGQFSSGQALSDLLKWSSNASVPYAGGTDFNWAIPNAGGVPGIAPGGANRVFISSSFEAGENPVKTARLQLNGHERMDKREGRYFNLVQPYQHHENVPSMGINVYSFALKPEEHQPSGTCNMSRIDNATLVLELTDNTVKKQMSGSTAFTTRGAKVKVYAINYNVLRIMSGMGGLAYSN